MAAMTFPPRTFPCVKFTVCGRTATQERWNPALGVWSPVCPDHAKDATPFELRPVSTS